MWLILKNKYDLTFERCEIVLVYQNKPGIHTGIDLLLTQILRIDEEEFSLQNLSSDKPLPRLLASCKSI